jgi:inorganic pyrophosphatase
MNIYKDICDIPPHILNEMNHFFSVYKQLEHRETSLQAATDRDGAMEAIRTALAEYRKHFRL